MPERFHDFDEGLDPLPTEGPTFKLGGEEFHCVPLPPAGATLALVRAVGRDERGRQVYNLPDIDAFVHSCLIEKRVVKAEGSDVEVEEDADDIARWEALLMDKSRPIPISALGGVLMWLQAEYLNRPTGPSARS